MSIKIMKFLEKSKDTSLWMPIVRPTVWCINSKNRDEVSFQTSVILVFQTLVILILTGHAILSPTHFLSYYFRHTMQ